MVRMNKHEEVPDCNIEFSLYRPTTLKRCFQNKIKYDVIGYSNPILIQIRRSRL